MISIIAAVGKNNELGLNNSLIWHLPKDLLFFKNITLNHKIIMGRNTYLSLGKPLPNRENVILTSNKIDCDELTIIHNIKEILTKYLNNEEEVFIIGGASLYEYFINYAQKLYLTQINKTHNADVYFPAFNKEDFYKDVIDNNIENNISYEHVLYRRK